MTPPAYKEQLDRLENAIIGNGKEGLIARTIRIEERLNATNALIEGTKQTTKETKEKAEDSVITTTGLIGEVKTEIGEVKTEIVKLNILVETHQKSMHFSELLKKKEFWAIIILGFITLHFVSIYVPNLWDGMVALTGLPKLLLIPLY